MSFRQLAAKGELKLPQTQAPEYTEAILLTVYLDSGNPGIYSCGDVVGHGNNHDRGLRRCSPADCVGQDVRLIVNADPRHLSRTNFRAILQSKPYKPSITPKHPA